MPDKSIPQSTKSKVGMIQEYRRMLKRRDDTIESLRADCYAMSSVLAFYASGKSDGGERASRVREQS